MAKNLYGILTLDSRVRGNDKNDKSRDYDSHPRESGDPESKKYLSIIDVKIFAGFGIAGALFTGGAVVDYFYGIGGPVFGLLVAGAVVCEVIGLGGPAVRYAYCA
jgi:hypothetical protein